MSASSSNDLYKPLFDNDVRLLTIQPVKRPTTTQEQPSSAVRCALEHYPLLVPSSSTALRDELAKTEDYWASPAPRLRFEVADNRASHLKHGFGRAYWQQKPEPAGEIVGKLRRLHFGALTKSRIDGRFPWGDYVALSYTWGDDKDTREIFVNEKPMRVTANLEAALRQLRDKAPIRAGLKVWVDAISLDQSHTAEKDIHIKRMRDIYKRAFDVVIWLGDAFQDSDKGMRLAFFLSASCKDGDGKLEEYLDSDDRNIDQILGPRVPSLIGGWHALRTLMRNAYWDRAWIVQELFFSSRTSPVLCGPDHVELGDLSDATTKWIRMDTFSIVRKQMYGERLLLAAEGRYVDSLGRAPRTALEQAAAKYGGIMYDPEVQRVKGTSEAADLTHWTIDSKRIHFVNRLKFSLNGESGAHPANLVALGRESDATDPRDKIFAFTGLMDPEFVDGIKAGYDTPIDDVYAAFSVAWMKSAQELDLLTHCRLDDYPLGYNGRTWVPNWRNRDSLPLLYIGDLPRPYNAGSDEGPHSVSRDGKVLTVAGAVISTIDGISATEDETEAKIVQPRRTVNIYPDEDDSDVRDALWRTFLGNRDFKFNIPDAGDDWRPLLDIPLPQRGGYLPAPFDKSFYEYIELNAGFRINGRGLATYFANGGRREAIMTDATSVRMMTHTLLDSVMRGSLLTHRRRLITTLDGRIGLVPRASRQGDVIAVVLGCREPLVLRSVKVHMLQRWQVVGSCYVHGVMEGEILREMQTRKRAVDELHLC